MFILQENNDSNGTRIEIDNVSVSAVPVPAAVWLLGSGLIGLISVKRRKTI
ncbi:VPLPA-CTERM sorting domain-containing protein [Desulfosarcina ovata]|uniref:VPLPA-CTERM sorting domain-containing protein n=1 Tax=Desulfosarcina ovata TaxID=83564 RepID=UPI0012D35091